jgi:hypothetical protein
MATKTFDTLFEQLLNELTPVTAEFEPYAGSIKSSIGSAPGGGYLIGKIADTLSKHKGKKVTKEQVVDMISQELFDKVFPGGKNKANNEDAYRASISKALIEIVKGIQEKEGVTIPGAGAAVTGYTARVISQLGNAKKEYGAEVSKEEVKAAVDNEAEEDGDSESAEPKAPKAARYIDEAEYEILTSEELAEAGIELSDELKTYYGRIENLADQVQKGKELASAISGGEDIARGGQKVSALIRAGAIKYASSENSDQDIEALEAGEEDMEEVGRKEFEKSFGKVYKDYMASKPEAMSYGFED